jgi:hypothetical protein
MGIYCYTLRKNPVIVIDKDTGTPAAIGITKYAYKVSSYHSADYNRLVGRMETLAENARYANPNLVMTTFGDPKEHDFDRYGPMAVYRTTPTMTSFYDNQSPGVLIGFMYKSGKSYVFERREEKVAA